MITVQIRDSKNVPETFPQLYQLFEKWYTERGKRVPEQRHFIRKMREELGVESGKKKIQPYLYAFVGKYDKMSLELLAEGTTLSMVSNASWLFVRLRSKISSTTDKKNAHFYRHCQTHWQQIVAIKNRRNIQLSVFCLDFSNVCNAFFQRCICCKITFQKIIGFACFPVGFGDSVGLSFGFMNQVYLLHHAADSCFAWD